jgi:hypothetical protein
MEKGDSIIFQYDGGGSNDYVKLFWKGPKPLTGLKVIARDGDMDDDEYRLINRDLIMKIEVEKKT